MVNVAAKKRAKLEARRNRMERKKLHRKWFKCFWTKPYGHRYESDNYEAACVGCGKSKYPRGEDYYPY